MKKTGRDKHIESQKTEEKKLVIMKIQTTLMQRLQVTLRLSITLLLTRQKKAHPDPWKQQNNNNSTYYTQNPAFEHKAEQS